MFAANVKREDVKCGATTSMQCILEMLVLCCIGSVKHYNTVYSLTVSFSVLADLTSVALTAVLPRDEVNKPLSLV